MSWQKRKKDEKAVVVSRLKKAVASKKKKVAEEKVIAPVESVPVTESLSIPTGPLCECGNPVAPGQTGVCKDHIRSN